MYYQRTYPTVTSRIEQHVQNVIGAYDELHGPQMADVLRNNILIVGGKSASTLEPGVAALFGGNDDSDVGKYDIYGNYELDDDSNDGANDDFADRAIDEITNDDFADRTIDEITNGANDITDNLADGSLLEYEIEGADDFAIEYDVDGANDITDNLADGSLLEYEIEGASDVTTIEIADNDIEYDVDGANDITDNIVDGSLLEYEIEGADDFADIDGDVTDNIL